jgi:hypothetical protein
MNATLNYIAQSGYYEIAYSIESGRYATRITVGSGDVPSVRTDTTQTPAIASAVTYLVEGHALTVEVADTSDPAKYYKSVYTAINGSITANETHISTTINEV